MVTSTNLVVMPRKAVIHIQKSAAGPPRKMANATPPMLPVPTVPDSAVDSAWKWVVSPWVASFEYLPVTTPQACLKKRTWGKPRYSVKNSPTPSSRNGK